MAQASFDVTSTVDLQEVDNAVNQAKKEMLLASDDAKFFTEPHYNGFPAVMVRLPAVDVDDLEELVTDAWRCMAPKALVKEFDERHAR